MGIKDKFRFRKKDEFRITRPIMTAEASRYGSKLLLTEILYVLYALALVMGGIPAIIALAINYLKRNAMFGTFLESHFRYQIRTFWFTLLYLFIAFVLYLFGVELYGSSVWFFLAPLAWYAYRIGKGLLDLFKEIPQYVPKPQQKL